MIRLPISQSQNNHLAINLLLNYYIKLKSANLIPKWFRVAFFSNYFLFLFIFIQLSEIYCYVDLSLFTCCPLWCNLFWRKRESKLIDQLRFNQKKKKELRFSRKIYCRVTHFEWKFITINVKIEDRALTSEQPKDPTKKKKEETSNTGISVCDLRFESKLQIARCVQMIIIIGHDKPTFTTYRDTIQCSIRFWQRQKLEEEKTETWKGIQLILWRYSELQYIRGSQSLFTSFPKSISTCKVLFVFFSQHFPFVSVLHIPIRSMSHMVCYVLHVMLLIHRDWTFPLKVCSFFFRTQHTHTQTQYNGKRMEITINS